MALPATGVVAIEATGVKGIGVLVGAVEVFIEICGHGIGAVISGNIRKRSTQIICIPCIIP